MENESQKTVIRIIVAACAALLVLLVVALIYNIVKLTAVNARRDELIAQSAYLDTVIDKNGAYIDYCKTPEFIEDYARVYLDMVYRGEIVIEVK